MTEENAIGGKTTLQSQEKKKRGGKVGYYKEGRTVGKKKGQALEKRKNGGEKGKEWSEKKRKKKETSKHSLGFAGKEKKSKVSSKRPICLWTKRKDSTGKSLQTAGFEPGKGELWWTIRALGSAWEGEYVKKGEKKKLTEKTGEKNRSHISKREKSRRVGGKGEGKFVKTAV